MGVLFIAIVVGANPELGNAQQDKLEMVGKFFDRAHEEWPRHRTHLENTTQSLEQTVFAKESQMEQAEHVGDRPNPTPTDPPTTCNSTKRMQIGAEWSLVSCTTAVSGDLKHEVAFGITNESTYTQEFEKMVKDMFAAGMEFTTGPLVKNKLSGAGQRAFESAFSSSSSKETVDEVACEVFGGNWCMFQWHMTFEKCGSVIDWYSPITQCKRGMSPPGPPKGVERFEPGMQPSALWFVGDGMTGSWLFVAMVISMVVTLQRFRMKEMHMQDQLYLAS